MALASRPGDRRTAQLDLVGGDLVTRTGLVVLEAGELVGVVDDVLRRACHLRHLVNFGRAGMAWTVNASRPRCGRPDLEQPTEAITADQHEHPIVDVEAVEVIVVGAVDVLVVDSVSAGAPDDLGTSHRVITC